MTHPRASSQIDWGLFLLVVVGAQGFYGFLPFEESQRIQTVQLLSGAMLAILVARELHRAANAIASSPLFLFMAIWTVAAAVVSPRPGPSLYAAVVLIMMIAYTSQRTSTDEQTLHTFALATTVSLIPSIVGRVIPLGFPVLERSGSARGYAGYFQFNSWAGMCAAAALLSIVTAVVSSGLLWWHLPAAAGGLLVLVLAKSATSTVSLIAAIGILAAIAAWRRTSTRFKPFVILGVGMGISSAVIAFGDRFALISSLAEATGRDEGFTNRTDIWDLSRTAVLKSPIWGYGSGFWRSGDWTSAQNGFLEFALTVGVPATLALVAIVILSGWRLATTSGLLLPFWTFGVIVNLSISQIAVPTVASLALWLGVASASAITVGATRKVGAISPDGHSVSKARGFAVGTARTPLPILRVDRI